MITVALQMLLVILLLLTMTWCIVIHVRLRKMRLDGGELEGFVSRLNEATVRAEQTVRLMQEASRDVEKSLIERDRETRRQSQSLARLVENAARVASRLGNVVEQGATHVAELRSSASVEEVVPSRLHGRLDHRAFERATKISAEENSLPTRQAAGAKLPATDVSQASETGNRKFKARGIKPPAATAMHNISRPAHCPSAGASRNFQATGAFGQQSNRGLQDKLQTLR